jgi:hypothetical protein
MRGMVTWSLVDGVVGLLIVLMSVGIVASLIWLGVAYRRRRWREGLAHVAALLCFGGAGGLIAVLWLSQSLTWLGGIVVLALVGAWCQISGREATHGNSE